MVNRFNLIDEPWIPISGNGKASLKDIFTLPNLSSLGGNAVEKIAVTKLLQAIAQSSATPQDDNEWSEWGWKGVNARCLAYLSKFHDRFYLYGEQPFLQMPTISKAKVKSFGTLSVEVATGNTTVLTQIHQQKSLSDSQKALVLLVQISCALGGKKVDNSIVLSDGYRGKDKPTGKPGPAIGYYGYLHSFWQGDSISQSIWLNLFTKKDISSMTFRDLGIAPWETMPQGEYDEVAEALTHSLLGRLVPMSRFCLLTDEGIHYSDGVVHSDYTEGKFDPSISVDFSQKKPRALWTSVTKRPWRELGSLLKFIEQDNTGGWNTLQLSIPLRRVTANTENFGIWSGGLRVSNNSGEQYASGLDDYVESELKLHADVLGTLFLERFKNEMKTLDMIQFQLKVGVSNYFSYLSNADKAFTTKATPFVSSRADKAIMQFWELCERQAQSLINCCEYGYENKEVYLKLRRTFCDNALTIFDHHCSQSGPRQLQAWVRARPDLSKFLNLS